MHESEKDQIALIHNIQVGATAKVTFAFFSLLEHAVEQGSAMVAKRGACERVCPKLVFSSRILMCKEMCALENGPLGNKSTSK
jgi:hypothetical protein